MLCFALPAGVGRMGALGRGARQGPRSLPLGLVLCWGNLWVQVLGLGGAGLFSGWSQRFLWALSHPQSHVTRAGSLQPSCFSPPGFLLTGRFPHLTKPSFQGQILNHLAAQLPQCLLPRLGSPRPVLSPPVCLGFVPRLPVLSSKQKLVFSGPHVRLGVQDVSRGCLGQGPVCRL